MADAALDPSDVKLTPVDGNPFGGLASGMNANTPLADFPAKAVGEAAPSIGAGASAPAGGDQSAKAMTLTPVDGDPFASDATGNSP